MARKDDYRDTPRFCVLCTKPIPPERKWDAITCSKECTKLRRSYAQCRMDQTECRYCRRPSTPEERARYAAWKRWEKAGQSDEVSAAALLRENVRLKLKLAELKGESTNDGEPKEGKGELSNVGDLRAS